MSSLKDTFSKLKQTIVGVSSADIDAKLDSAVKDITSYKSHSGSNGYIELVRSVISKTGEFQLNVGQGGLFSQGSSPASLGQGSRLVRYKNYDAIVYNINYCFRALTVLADNILSPDDITKVSLDIIPQSYLEDEVPTESKTKYVEEALSKLKLEKHLVIIVKNTLKYGDFFVEIADAKTALNSQSILSEGVFSDINTDKEYKDILKFNDLKITFELDYTSFFDKNKKTKDKDDVINNVHLLYHEPHRVVKLQSDMFPLCFGYLIFPKATYNPQMSFGDESVNNICRQLLDSLSKKIPQTKEFKNNDDLQDVIKSMIKGTDPNNQLIGIRYVPPDKVEHFHVPSTRFYPYGESIYESCSYSAKVLIAMETALAISRISRSTEKRKIQIEIGLPRDAAKAIESMKEEFRKRKVSLDSFGSIDTIPCLDLDTKIQLTNGKNIILGDLIKYFKEGIEFEVYAYDKETGTIVPNKVENASISGLDVEVVKVTLDNDKYELCTPDHLWMLRDGSYKEAKDLLSGDSLMSFDSDVKVLLINSYKESRDVGDIQTNLHNFGLNSGVFVHNSMISTFEDIYIPTKDGKPFVDVNTFTEGNIDVRSKVDELKFIRDSIIASLDVPPSFLSLEENISNKAALSEENILFARAIVGHQKYLSEQITELTEKILQIINPEKALDLLDNISVALPAPKSLQFERESKYMSDVANLIETLERIGIPKEYSKKKYLTQIDWDDVRKYEIEQNLEKDLGVVKDEEPGGMGGMGGAGGFGM